MTPCPFWARRLYAVVRAPIAVPRPWLRFWARLKRSAPAALGVSAAVAAFLYVLSWAPYAAVHWVEASGAREAARRAHEADLSYADVLKNPESSRGKPVFWWVLHPNRGEWSYAGTPGGPIRFAGKEPDLVTTGQSGSMNAHKIVATIVEVDNGAVVLAYRDPFD